MKKAGTVNIGGAAAFEASALRILRETPGLTVVAERAKGRDAYIRVHGKRTPILVKCRSIANAATAWHIVHEAETQPRKRLLLIADQTTAEARQILRDHGIAVVDGLGNAHIEIPGLLFHLEGRRRPKAVRGKARPARLQGKAGLVAQMLLLVPERAWQVADLTKETGVSAGLAHRVLARLEGEGIMAAEGAGPKRVRRVIRPKALLDLWAEEDAYRPTRTFAHRLGQEPQQLLAELGRGLGRNSIDHAFTGAAAANLIAPFVTAIPVVELWASSAVTPSQLCDAAGADPVTEGHNIVFLQAKDDTPLAFRSQVNGLWVVNRFRLYSDLRRDPRRGREQAEHLRREVIGL